MAPSESNEQTAAALQEPLLLSSPTNDETRNDSIPPNNNTNTAPGDSESPPRLSRNIPLALAYQFMRCAPEGVWLNTVMPAYVYLLRPHRPDLVGYMSALEGVTQFVAACLAGVVADWYRRDVLQRMASLVGLVASSLIVWSSATRRIVPLAVGLSLNGAFDGIQLTSGMALFADSIVDGQRSYYFTLRTLATTLGYVMGPLFGLVMFVLQGDQWTVQSCAHVMIAAQLLLLPAFGLLWFLRDVPKKEPETTTTTNNATASASTASEATTTRSDEENIPVQPDDSATLSLLASSDVQDKNAQPQGQENCRTTTTQPVSDIAQETNGEYADETGGISNCGGCLELSRPRWIALCCASSDIVCSVANGISTNYFAIFFVKDLLWGPVLVQVLGALSCLIGAGLLLMAQKVSLVMGRCLVSVLFKAMGTVLLLSMVACYVAFPATVLSHTAIAGLYLLQNAFLNSTGALTRSLIMDYVPSDERAKWSALESINIFGWCGSAALGGIVIQYFEGSILPVFYLTAILQLVGSVPLMTLFGVEEKEAPLPESAQR